MKRVLLILCFAYGVAQSQYQVIQLSKATTNDTAKMSGINWGLRANFLTFPDGSKITSALNFSDSSKYVEGLDSLKAAGYATRTMLQADSNYARALFARDTTFRKAQEAAIRAEHAADTLYRAAHYVAKVDSASTPGYVTREAWRLDSVYARAIFALDTTYKAAELLKRILYSDTTNSIAKQWWVKDQIKDSLAEYVLRANGTLTGTTSAAAIVPSGTSGQMGWFKRNATAPQSGTITTATATDTIQAAISDKGGQVFNVKTYGAKGDGSTNDFAAIASAIAAVPDSGGVLFFPAGIYKVQPTTSRGIVLKRNMIVAGVGRGSKLDFSNALYGYVTIMSLDTIQNVTIRDLFFDGNSDAGIDSLDGIHLDKSTNVTIENCYFEQIADMSIGVYGSAKVTINNNRVSYPVSFGSGQNRGVDIDIYLADNSTCSDINVTNNYFNSWTKLENVERVMYIGNRFLKRVIVEDNAVEVTGTGNVSFFSNQFTDTVSVGVISGTVSFSGGNIFDSLEVIVTGTRTGTLSFTGNTFRSSHLTIDSGGPIEIVDNKFSGTPTGNFIYGSVAVGYCNKWTVRGNIINSKLTDKNCINLVGASQSAVVEITDNTIFGQTGSTFQYGIIANNVSRSTISRNHVTDTWHAIRCLKVDSSDISHNVLERSRNNALMIDSCNYSRFSRNFILEVTSATAILEAMSSNNNIYDANENLSGKLFTIIGAGSIITNTSAGVYSGPVTATDFRASDSVSAVSGAFSGQVSGTNAVLSGYTVTTDVRASDSVAAVSGAFTGQVSGTNGVMSGFVSATDFRATDSVSAATGRFSGNLSAGELALDSAAYGSVYIADTYPDSIDVTAQNAFYTVGAKQSAIRGKAWTSGGVLKNVTVQDSSMTVAVDGNFEVSWSASFRTESGVTNGRFNWYLFINDVKQEKTGAKRLLSGTNDLGVVAVAPTVLALKKNDIIKLKFQSLDDPLNVVVFEYAIMHVKKITD